MADFIIELGYECATVCTGDGCEVQSELDGFDDWIDCTGSGDAQPACEFMLDNYKIEFRIVAKNDKGEYENRLATDSELQAVCESIYFESESDFSDRRLAEIYLVWQAADDVLNAHCERLA